MDDSTRDELAKMDRYHMQKGDYGDWMLSEERTHFCGDQRVRLVNSTNLHELCEKAGLDEAAVQRAYDEAVQTGDVLFITYEDPDREDFGHR